MHILIHLLLFLLPSTTVALPIQIPELQKFSVSERREPGSMNAAEHVGLRMALNADDVEMARVMSILPTRFRLVNGRGIQSTVDSLVTEILDTETGRRAFCPFSVFSIDQLRRHLGISREAAEEIALKCVRQGSRLAEIEQVRLMKNLPPKVWIFLFGEEDPGPAESYTSRYNVSYVVTGPVLTRERLVRAMAHELAVSYDQLSRLADLNDPGNWDQGLEIALSRSAPVYPAFKPVENIHQLKCALRNPAIRYAFTNERAYAFEDRIIRELGWLAVSPPMSSPGICEPMLRRNMVPLTYLPRVLLPSSSEYNRECGPLSREALDEQITFLEFMILQSAHRTSALSLCQLLAQPHVGPFVQPFDAPAPRPAMGRP